MELKELFKKSELIPVIIQDEETKDVLMLGFTNLEAVQLTLKTKTADFAALFDIYEMSSGIKAKLPAISCMWLRCAPIATPIPCFISAAPTGLPAIPASAAAFSAK